MLRILLGRSIIAAVLISVQIYYVSFDTYRRPDDKQIKTAEVAVVFTGQFDRIDEALQLLSAGAVGRVFISGLNAGAGLSPSTFTQQFAKRNELMPNVPALIACCVQWAAAAQNTVQNGIETACWLRENQVAGPILLITSAAHMARAKLSLLAAGVRNPVIAYPTSDQSADSSQTRELEFAKLLGFALAASTQPLTRLDASGVFKSGCPKTNGLIR